MRGQRSRRVTKATPPVRGAAPPASVARVAQLTVSLSSCVKMRLAALFALLTLVAADDLSSPLDLLRTKFYSMEQELWRNISDPLWLESGLGGDVEITRTMVDLNNKIEMIPRPSRPPIKSWLWSKAQEKLQLIDGMYKNVYEFMARQAVPGVVPAPVHDWLDLAEGVIIDKTTAVAPAVQKLHDLLEHGDLFRSILMQDEHSDVCELQLSPHQLIYDTYNTISLTEIKGYAMMQFSWMLLRIYGKGNYTQEASLTRQRYGERTSQTAAAARAALAMASRDLYRCDPPQHKEGETYAEVTRFLQGYIENEVDMNEEGTCRDNCAGYSLAKNHGCFKDQFCIKQRKCKGTIHDCQYVDSDMWVCPAGRDSNRRYDWIKYENGLTFGKGSETCTRGTTKVDSWWRWLFWHCSYCMCVCDDASPDSDRYFSLYETVSDVKNNKVVTGVRLVKLGRVFHLQISEGTLGERGAVTPNDWVPVQRFDPNDAGVAEDVDYYKLKYSRRAVDLDVLDSPPGHVLTGVRFRMHGPHLHFEIRATAFNYATGRLTERYEWHSNDNTDASERPRQRLELYKPDIPTRSHVPLREDSTHDQYIDFTHTDFEADAAQSTVPFLDIQPVQPMKGGSLLSGAGIMHRGARGSGGFLALKVRTYNYAAHIKAEPPASEFDVDDDTTDFSPVIH